MKRIAFIPARGGSKSIPNKNIKSFCGRPLIFWTLEALENCKSIDQAIVATDSEDIKSVVEKFNFSKVRIFIRSKENAQDTSSTESVMIEYLSKAKHKITDQFILVQTTNPFLQSCDLENALATYKSQKANSLLSVVRTKRFFWSQAGRPTNYDYKKRPRRQDFAGTLMENGAFYISTVGGVIKSRNRLSGKIITYEMNEYSGFEIDEPSDWSIAEVIFRTECSDRIRKSTEIAAKQIKLFLTDVDGVLTDAGMYYSENGDELKKFNTHDGLALRYIQAKLKIKTGIVTTENKKLNERRAEKLKLDYLRQGVSNKYDEVQSICKDLGISLQQVAFIGDDVNDEKLLANVGFAACPANASSRIKKLPNVVQLSKAGGFGCLREWAEYLFGEVDWYF